MVRAGGDSMGLRLSDSAMAMVKSFSVAGFMFVFLSVSLSLYFLIFRFVCSCFPWLLLLAFVVAGCCNLAVRVVAESG